MFADYVEPSSVSVSVAKYPIVKDALKPLKYFYDIKWQGIPVGSAVVDVTLGDSKSRGMLLKDYSAEVISQDDLYSIKAEAKSAKAIDVFYKLRHESESLLRKSTFSPLRFQTWQTENSRIKKAEVKFKQDGLIDSFSEKDGKIERQNVFTSSSFILDPISAAFFARSIPIEVGGRAEFDVFNGKHRYLIVFNVVSKEVVEIMGKKREAYKTVPEVRKLTDTEGEKRLTEAALWIAADDSREVLKLESKVFVGRVGAVLTKVEDPTFAENQVLTKK